MEKAVSIQAMFTGSPFYGRFGAARRAGFSLVEFGGWTELDLSRVTEELSAHSLRLHAMTGADRFSLTRPGEREGFLEYLSQSMAVAKSLGCRNLIVQSADGGDAAEEAPAPPAGSADFTGRAAAARALMEAADKALRAGVTLFLKPAPAAGASFSYLHTNSSAGSLVKVINSPALRLLFDFGLARRMEDGDASAFGKYRGQIGHVHIGDAAGGLPDGDLGPGLRLIREVLDGGPGYGGTVGFVFGPGGNERARLAGIAEAFK